MRDRRLAANSEAHVHVIHLFGRSVAVGELYSSNRATLKQRNKTMTYNPRTYTVQPKLKTSGHLRKDVRSNQVALLATEEENGDWSMPNLKAKRVGGLAVGVVSAAMSVAVRATPVHYSESVSGDLGPIPSTGFLFDVGTNTITGTTHFGVNTPGHPHFDGDFDSFAFRVPTGDQVADISVGFSTISDNADKANVELRFCAGVGDCGSDLLGTQTVNLLGASPVQTNFGVTLPFAAGSYSVISSGLGIAPVDATRAQESWSADYAWNVDVVSVPEPGILSMFGVSLIGLAVAIRRRGSQWRVASPKTARSEKVSRDFSSTSSLTPSSPSRPLRESQGGSSSHPLGFLSLSTGPSPLGEHLPIVVDIKLFVWKRFGERRYPVTLRHQIASGAGVNRVL